MCLCPSTCSCHKGGSDLLKISLGALWIQAIGIHTNRVIAWQLQSVSIYPRDAGTHPPPPHLDQVFIETSGVIFRLHNPHFPPLHSVGAASSYVSTYKGVASGECGGFTPPKPLVISSVIQIQWLSSVYDCIICRGWVKIVLKMPFLTSVLDRPFSCKEALLSVNSHLCRLILQLFQFLLVNHCFTPPPQKRVCATLPSFPILFFISYVYMLRWCSWLSILSIPLTLFSRSLIFQQRISVNIYM